MLDLTGYKLTFSDEFNTRSISQTGAGTTWADIRPKWRLDANSDIGFGNSSFVDSASGYDPFAVKGGTLSITAVPDRTPFGYKGSWESGLITTQGGFSQTYGYFEMRANLADKPGAWDAFWLLPDKPAANPGNLPGWQELDVVEHLGSNNQGTYRWIHTTDPGPNKNPNLDLQVYSNNPSQVSGFHTYGMNWQKDTIGFYFDGQLMGSRPTPSDMHGPMHLLADLAIKGSSANNAAAPITMEIDYIRAYSKAVGAFAVTQGAVSAPDGYDPGLYGATSKGSPAPAAPASTPVTTSTGSGADKLGAAIDTQSQPQNRPYFGTVTHDMHSAAGEVYALYDALLGRPADALGLASWTNAVGHGLLVKDVAEQFLASSEGQVRAGALDSAGFVEQLYGAALHRHSDAVGLQSWIALLAQGTSRADVAIGFALSPEHLGSLQTTFNAGVFVADTSAAAAARLYYGILDRAPDAAGLSAWTSAIEKGAPVAAVAHQFLASPEAQLKFAGADDARFVTGLYENALGRTADSGGLQYWLGALQHGSSRAEVASSVTDSHEAQIHLVGQIETGWHLI